MWENVLFLEAASRAGETGLREISRSSFNHHNFFSAHDCVWLRNHGSSFPHACVSVRRINKCLSVACLSTVIPPLPLYFSWPSLFYSNNESVAVAVAPPSLAPPSLCLSCFSAFVFPRSAAIHSLKETVLTLIPLTAMATHSLVTSPFTSLTVSHL